MDTGKKYSLAIRLVCGALGLLGFAAIGFNAVQTGSVEVGFMFFASMLAGFIFLYVALFGSSPLDCTVKDEGRSD